MAGKAAWNCLQYFEDALHHSVWALECLVATYFVLILSPLLVVFVLPRRHVDMVLVHFVGAGRGVLHAHEACAHAKLCS